MRIFLATFPMHLNGFLDKIDGTPMVYLASSDADITNRHSKVAGLIDQPIKILASFHYFRKVDFEALLKNFQVKPMIFADSGAFSAATQGAPIDVDEYGEWLLRWKHLFTTYSNLDVIRNPEESDRNQRILERKGLEPIPVFHTASDFAVLDDLAERYPYIALGGMVNQPPQANLKWAATVMKRTEHLGTRYHGFGVPWKPTIEKLPWYSVDSTSWVSAAKFATLTLYDGREWRKAHVGEANKIRQLASIIRFYGFDPEQFTDLKRYTATKGHTNISIIAALSWLRYEKNLQKRNQSFRGVYLAQHTTDYHEATERFIRPQSATVGSSSEPDEGRSECP